MQEAKEDKRVRYTKLFLKESLLELMKEKPVDRITTTELCRKAEINRNTFYSHFNTVRDVLEIIESEVEQKIMSLLDFKQSPNEMMPKIMQSIHQSNDVYKILLSPNGDFMFMRKLFYKLEEKVGNEIQRQQIKIDKDYMHYLFSFLFFGCISIVRNWLDEGMKQSPEDITKFMLGLVTKGMETFS